MFSIALEYQVLIIGGNRKRPAIDYKEVPEIRTWLQPVSR